MTADEVAAGYAQLGVTYDQVVEMLVGAETDLGAVAQVLAGIDAGLAALPAPAAISGLDRDGALRLAAAARACDSRRQLAFVALTAARSRILTRAADEERAGRAIQAYRGGKGAGDGRFIDQRR